jgi:hypothetical protein
VLAEFLRDKLELLYVLEAFGEDHVSSSIDVGLASVNSAINAFNASSISPSAYDEVSVRACVTGVCTYLNLFHHIFNGDQRLAIEMPAPFGELLVFQVKAGSTCLAVLPDCLGTHFALTEASVGISD